VFVYYNCDAVMRGDVAGGEDTELGLQGRRSPGGWPEWVCDALNSGAEAGTWLLGLLQTRSTTGVCELRIGFCVAWI
jgi:hypothetical protein